METDQYVSLFLDECRDYLQILNDQLLLLEQEPGNRDIIGEIFRAAHTLKGMAAAMGYEKIAALTHSMENVFEKIRSGQIAVHTEMMDTFFAVIEHLEGMLADIAGGKKRQWEVAPIQARLEEFAGNAQGADGSGGRTPQGTGAGSAAPQGMNADSTTLHGKGGAGPQGPAGSGVNLLGAAGAGENSQRTTGVAGSPPPGAAGANGTNNGSSPAGDADEFVMRIAGKGREMGYVPYKITVQLHKDCLLKGARAYMVITALEDCGEVIQTSPPVEDLEEGRFDGEFSLILLSRDDRDVIQDLLLNILEVEEVQIEALEEIPLSGADGNRAESRGNSGNWPVFSNNNSNTIRVQINKIDEVLNLFEEFVIERGRLETIAETLKNRRLDECVENISRITSQTQTVLLSLRMVPVHHVFSRFPRMIRDLCRELDKKVDFRIYGGDTELDRLVLDEISDPLIHMIRNSLDHGIERPEERRKKGKPETGTVILRAYHSGNHVYIEIEDDGAGLDREKIAAKAVEKGLLTAGEAAALSDGEILQYLFIPGFSTADKVSGVSGRGVGLDVVKNKIESLGGHLFVSSRRGEGTVFTIQLPLTLSIISSLLVQVRGRTFAIPLSSIIRIYKLKREEILTIGHKRAMEVRGKLVPLVSLSEVFWSAAGEDREETAVVLVKKGDRTAGLVVDRFIGQKEIVIKSLGRYLGEVFGFSGATILGDGRIALVLDPDAFFAR